MSAAHPWLEPTDGPIGSPVEFYADGISIYAFPQPNSSKLIWRRDG